MESGKETPRPRPKKEVVMRCEMGVAKAGDDLDGSIKEFKRV